MELFEHSNYHSISTVQEEKEKLKTPCTCIYSVSQIMEQLPYEIIEHILSFLPLASLSVVWQVDRRMRDVLRSKGSPLLRDIALEHILELVHKHGNSDLAEFLITLPSVDPNKIV